MVMMMSDYPPLTCGIDPGLSGGIAFLGEGFSEAYPMPDTESDIAALLREFAPHIRIAYIKAVHSHSGHGVASMFKFGRSYGFLRGLLIGLGIPFDEVSPQRWAKATGCIDREMEDCPCLSSPRP